MSKIVNLAQAGQAAVDVDLSSLTMVCFSQNGRRIMHYHTHGDHTPAENAEAPFDRMTILRRLQFAKSGFVMCANPENAIIVDPEKVDYLIVEPSSSKDEAIVSIGLPGMKTPYIIQTPVEDATQLVEVMHRFFHPLSQPLENGHALLFRTTALRAARFKSDGRTVVLDFDTAGEATVIPGGSASPVAPLKGDGLRAAYQKALGTACGNLQRRLINAIDDMHVINHAHGTLMVPAKKIIAAIAHDEVDSNPRIIYLLDSRQEPKIASLEFATTESRDLALAQILSGIEDFDDLGGMDGMQGLIGLALAPQVVNILTETIDTIDKILPVLKEQDAFREQTPQPPTMPGRGQARPAGLG